MYNLTDVFNQTNLVATVQALNTESAGMLGITFLVMVFLVMLVALLDRGFDNAVIASGFVSSISALLFFAMGLIEPWIIIFPFLALMGGVLYKKLWGD